ncbi:hypothetical protein Trydic_g7715 [Trypoxylus dichotomus]
MNDDTTEGDGKKYTVEQMIVSAVFNVSPPAKESLKENPSLSLRERARELGLSRSTLLKILQEDLNMVFEVDDNDNNPNKRYAMCSNGRWIKKQRKSEAENDNIKEEPSTSKDSEEENDAKEPDPSSAFSEEDEDD